MIKMSDASSGIWHDGDELVVRMSSPRFPQRCLKSGKPIGAGLTSIDVVDAPQFERWKLSLRLPLSPSWQKKSKSKVAVAILVASVILLPACGYLGV